MTQPHNSNLLISADQDICDQDRVSERDDIHGDRAAQCRLLQAGDLRDQDAPQPRAAAAAAGGHLPGGGQAPVLLRLLGGGGHGEQGEQLLQEDHAYIGFGREWEGYS